MIPDPSPPFEFGISQAVLERMRDLVRRAAAIGIGSETRAAMLVMEHQLRTRPRDWGDPLYHLRGLQVTAFSRVYDRLQFVYTVHDRVPMVSYGTSRPR